MEQLPPIRQVYVILQANHDYSVHRKYQSSRTLSKNRVSPTKKGSFLDDAIKASFSPGPANSANIQKEWKDGKVYSKKHSQRKTYIDEIQEITRRKNFPSPDRYQMDYNWLKKKGNQEKKSKGEKPTFLTNAEYESNLTPGPGSYLLGEHLGSKIKKYTYSQTHSIKQKTQTCADMTTYDPVPAEYNTFKKYEKEKSKSSKGSTVSMASRDVKQNKYPGPGKYPLIHSWAPIKPQNKSDKDMSCYLDKISKPAPRNVYYY